MESGKSIRWITAAVLTISAALSALFFAPLRESADAAIPANIAAAVHLMDHVTFWSDDRNAGRHGVQWSVFHRCFEPLAGGPLSPGILSSCVRPEISRYCERLLLSTTDDTIVRPIRYVNDPVRAGPRRLA